MRRCTRAQAEAVARALLAAGGIKEPQERPRQVNTRPAHLKIAATLARSSSRATNLRDPAVLLMSPRYQANALFDARAIEASERPAFARRDAAVIIN